MEENSIEIPAIAITKIKIYIQTDTNKIVTAINSSIFLQDITGWTEIDEGNGDKYAHAQSQYLTKGLMDEKGRYNYKYDTELIELTEAEKEVLFPPSPILPTEVDLMKQELANVQEAFDFMIMGGI